MPAPTRHPPLGATVLERDVRSLAKVRMLVEQAVDADRYVRLTVRGWASCRARR
jgi:hypothetical protein